MGYKVSPEQEARILDAMRYAGEMIKHARDEGHEHFSVWSKAGDSNFVTSCDLAIQDYLLPRLLEIVPGARIMSEEQENDKEALGEGLCFVVDPLDGTLNFIHDYRYNGISVALFDGKEQTFGAVYDVWQDDMYTAHRGRGAYLNGKPIHVANNEISKSLVLFGTGNYWKDIVTDATFAIAKELFLLCTDVRRCGAATVDICSIASGKADIYVEMGISPWDHAAGSLIIREAGGVISQFDGS
ncbi:MAG: inositol monophosphatase, partial [Clostridia bacterium]|nr:inositol monophosphatase [Clostridia bacterium]